MLNTVAPLAHVLDRRALAASRLLVVAAAASDGVVLALLLPVVRALADGRSAVVPVGVLVGVWALSSVLHVAAVRTSRDVGYRIGEPLHDAVADHVAAAPAPEQDTRRSGRISQLAGADVMHVITGPGHLDVPLLGALVTPLSAVAVLAVLDPVTGLVALLGLPVMFLAQGVTAALVVRNEAALHATMSDANARMIEFAQSQRLLRSSGSTAAASRHVRDAMGSVRQAQRRLIGTAMPALGGFTFTVQVVLTVVVAVLAARTHAMDPLAVVVAGIVAARAMEPVLALGELGAAARLSRAAAQRVADLLQEPVVPEPRTPARLPSGPVTVDLDAVTVQGSSGAALDRVSVQVPAGCVTAVVGPSGAGKSTFLRATGRLLDPDSGTVRMNGVDLRDLGTATVADVVAPVFQDTFLVDGTLADNIRLGRPDATDEEFRAATHAACVDEIADALPQGYRTPLSHGGSALSGGQRQRVAIARALLKDAPVLLLDEPTSALDASTERRVLERLRGALHGRTVVLVTHHRRVLDLADEVVTLDAGALRHTTHEPTASERTVHAEP